MGLLDVVLRRVQHVFHTALPPDECRRRLGSGIPVFPSPTSAVNPFVVYWTSADHARIRLNRTGGRRRAPRIMRVHLIPEGTGTVIEGTTELAPSQPALGLVMLSVFGLVGYASTSYYLSHGSNLFQALFPFGYAALFVLFALVALIAQPSDQEAVLVDNVGGVLQASSVDSAATSNVAPEYPQPPVPAPQWTSPVSPPFVTPVAPAWPPVAQARGRVLPHHLTLRSPLSITDCVQRIGPDSGDASSQWAGSRGSGLAVVWKDVYEVELSKSGLYRRNPRHVVRARLSTEPNGTLIETDDLMSPSSKRIIRYLAAVLGGWSLVLFVWGGRFALLNLLPLFVLVIVLTPAQYFLSRRATANQHAFIVATLQSLLGATPAPGNRA